MNLNGVEYYYIRNAQGDIIGLFDKTGTQVVSYSYDSWGKLISIDGTLKDSVGVKNPYRYRGYRYDSETGLYYLNSRYYNPEWGRFVNADSITGQTGDLLGHNMFSYCKNNPVNHADPSGYWVVDAIFLAVDVAQCISNPSVANVGWVLLDVVSFADPTGSASTAEHVVKTAHEMEESVHAVEEAGHAGELLGRYNKVKDAVQGMGLETHHLVEKRFAEKIGVEKTDEMLSVALTKEEHRIYTNRWRKEIKYGVGTSKATRETISAAINNVYHDNEVLCGAAQRWLSRCTQY